MVKREREGRKGILGDDGGNGGNDGGEMAREGGENDGEITEGSGARVFGDVLFNDMEFLSIINRGGIWGLAGGRRRAFCHYNTSSKPSASPWRQRSPLTPHRHPSPSPHHASLTYQRTPYVYSSPHHHHPSPHPTHRMPATLPPPANQLPPPTARCTPTTSQPASTTHPPPCHLNLFRRPSTGDSCPLNLRSYIRNPRQVQAFNYPATCERS